MNSEHQLTRDSSRQVMRVEGHEITGSTRSIPTVSVVIPNYNHAQYLKQRIDSVLKQTYQDLEIIILDDCSTDNSREIIEQYRHHQKVSLINYNEVNSGSTFRQWAKGIEFCRGDYVWIAESDDWCEPGFVETVMDGITKTRGCVLGYCQSYCIDNRNLIRWQSLHGWLDDMMEGREFITKKMISNTAVFNASMALWKRQAYFLITKEYTNFRCCGDWLFWIELCRHGNVYISGKLLNYFRKHDHDVSSKDVVKGELFIEEVKMFTILLNRKWISYRSFLIGLFNIYLEYKTVSKSLDRLTHHKIKEVLFYDASVKRYLRRSYVIFRIRRAVQAMGFRNC